MVWVGDAEVAVSCGASDELKIEANQIIAINPPMVESDPRFSLTSINHREAKASTSGELASEPIRLSSQQTLEGLHLGTQSHHHSAPHRVR